MIVDAVEKNINIQSLLVPKAARLFDFKQKVFHSSSSRRYSAIIAQSSSMFRPAFRLIAKGAALSSRNPAVTRLSAPFRYVSNNFKFSSCVHIIE